MSKRDLVKTTVYLTDPRFIDDFRAARKKVMGSALYTNTMVFFDGLATPDLVVEIEAWADGRQGTQSK
jgi:enamine deaminase RidA (YjgF/YER057c/UK114 family)